MPNFQIACSRCSVRVTPPPTLGQVAFPCPSCGSPFDAWLFPASLHPMAQATPSEQALDGEATCYNHVTRKAVLVCESCGRFLCSLCDLETNQRHYCPSCFEARQSAGRLGQLPTQLLRYDRIVLALSLFSALLCCWPSFLTAPAVFFMAFRYWNAPGSESAGARVGIVSSVVLSLLQLGWWAVIIIALAFLPELQEMEQ